MNAQLTMFTSLEHYEAELAGSITPMIADKFEALDETSADLLQVSQRDAIPLTFAESPVVLSYIALPGSSLMPQRVASLTREIHDLRLWTVGFLLLAGFLRTLRKDGTVQQRTTSARDGYFRAGVLEWITHAGGR